MREERQGRRRSIGWAVAAGIFVLAATACSQGGGDATSSTRETTASDPTDAGPTTLLALGDSYSSGEGTEDSEGDCGRSPTAYPALVADRTGLQPTILTCTGAKLPDVRAQLDAAGDRRFDVVTLTVGGNDAGFSTLLADCIGLDDAIAIATDEDTLGTFSLRNCDVTPAELDERAGALSDELGALYRQIAEEHLSAQGRLIVVGYPRLLAPSDTWPAEEGERCDGISRSDADALGTGSARLNETIAAAVDTVAQARFVDAAAAFAGHERCTDEPWVLGFTVRPRLRSSFHPNEAGHRAIADRVTEATAAD